MRKFIYYSIAIALLTVSCSSNNKTKDTNEANKIDEKLEQKSASTDPYFGKVRHITSEEFKELIFDYTKNPEVWVYKGKKPCVIDFYADWCRPCKMISPYLEELAVEYAGKVNFYKIDTQAEQEVTQVFNVQSIPLVIFCGMKGNPVGTTGAMEKNEYKKYVESLLTK